MSNQVTQQVCRKAPVLLDTCTIIGLSESRDDVIALRKKIAKSKNVRVIVPSILVREVAKVARISSDEAVALIESFSLSGQVEFIGHSGDDEGNAITREAEVLKAKYPEYCHYPDNHYLVYCKDQGAVLITLDKDLRLVARLEGIMTCAPGNFQLY